MVDLKPYASCTVAVYCISPCYSVGRCIHIVIPCGHIKTSRIEMTHMRSKGPAVNIAYHDDDDEHTN